MDECKDVPSFSNLEWVLHNDSFYFVPVQLLAFIFFVFLLPYGSLLSYKERIFFFAVFRDIYFHVADASTMFNSVKSKLCQKFPVRVKKKVLFISSCFLVNFGLTGFNFPAKRLRFFLIRGALKIRMRRFYWYLSL